MDGAPPIQDAAYLFDGICFEAAEALSGQIFTLRDGSQLAELYQRIDDSEHCNTPILRHDFDFGARSLVGTWTYAPRGCTAAHTVESIVRDAAARTVTLSYRFETAGECPYELIRPLWVAVEAPAGHALSLTIQMP